jgi:hypothetical protein
MDATHLHLILNHVPVIGAPIGLLLLGWAVVRRNEEVGRAAMGVFIIAALVAIPVFLTGESAEHAIERLGVAPESLVEQHEQAALFALIGTSALGLVALAALIISLRGRHTLTHAAMGLAGLVALATAGVTAWTANLGGQIRHTEIRAHTPDGLPDGESSDRNSKYGGGDDD